MFVHLHTHSYYSLLDGTIPVEELVQHAVELGYRHLALTDHNSLAGAVEFFRQASEAGLHPIIGAEVELTNQTRLVLLVQNEIGYRNLCTILTTGHLRGGHLKFQLHLEDIARYRPGLIVLSGGQKGELWQLARQRRIPQAQQYLRLMKRLFGEHFYVELQHFESNDMLTNLRLRDLAAEFRLPIVATNDVHLLRRADHSLRRVLHAIDQNSLLDRITTAGSPEQYLKSPREMRQLFQHFPQAVRNTLHIARQCQFHFRLGKPIFPRIELPAGETSASHLRKQALQGARERYQPLPRAVRERLEYELSTIQRLGFPDYFLIVKDIVDFCHRERIPCVGRGSAGDSLVSYVLGITQVDPIRYRLYFERFLNPQRSDSPDIDLDICWKNRDRVLEYVYQKYGAERVAMISTFNTFQLRSSLRDVARAFGFPEEEIRAITRYLPHYGIKQLTGAIQQLPECRDLQQRPEMFRQVVEFAERLASFPRHQSIHPGGIVIAPDRLTHYTPLQVAGKGLVVTQYDMYSIEPLGLVKIDLLGVRSLTMITETLQQVAALHRRLEGGEPATSAGTKSKSASAPGEPDLPLFTAQLSSPRSPTPKPVSPPDTVFRFDLSRGRIVPEKARRYLTPERFPFLSQATRNLSPLDLRVIPEDDPNVTALLRSGLSLGCFQTESPGMRGLLRKMQIEGVDDVITAVALIRPGAANSGMKEQYIRRRAGLTPISYPHPALKPVLAETYGNIIYQEQVMQVAAEIAGFTLAQADILRKAMTKSRDRKMLQTLKQEFIVGARKRGVPVNQATAIWKFLENFVGYGFNKAHSATYGTIAYQTAYLKYYFPVQYMTAVLNNQGGFYSRAAYIEECRRMGIRLLPPDVNTPAREFTAHQDTIRVGLEPVYELTETTRQRILQERNRGAFRDFYDFLQRVRPRQGEVENLIKCGALRSLHPSEPELLLKTRIYYKHRRNRSVSERLTRSIHLPPYNLQQRILYEMEILGFAVSNHPLTLFARKIDWADVIPSFELERHKGETVRFVGWLVTSRRTRTSGGEYMKFLTLEDRYGLCEAVMFPEIYQRYGHLVKGNGPYQITGIVQSRLPGEANLLVQNIELIELTKEELEKELSLSPSTTKITQ